MGKKVTIYTEDGNTTTLDVPTDAEARPYEDLPFTHPDVTQVSVTDTEGGAR